MGWTWGRGRNKNKVGASVKVGLGVWVWIGIGIGVGVVISFMKSVLHGFIHFLFLLDIFFIYISNVFPFFVFPTKNVISHLSYPCSQSILSHFPVQVFPYTAESNLSRTTGLSSL